MREPFRLPDSPAAGRLGLLLSQLEEGRARTIKLLKRLADEGLVEDRLHWNSPQFPNSLAAHLAHLAAIELDWLYCDLLNQEIPAAALAGFPIKDVRQPDGRLSQAERATLPELLTLLVRARTLLVEECLRLEESRLAEMVEGIEGAATPEWILTHLIQHEAEHRGVLRRMAEAWRVLDSQ